MAKCGVNKGDDEDRQTVFAGVIRFNSRNSGGDLFRCFDVRQGDKVEFDLFKLGQQTFTERFGSDSGAIGYKINLTFHLTHLKKRRMNKIIT